MKKGDIKKINNLHGEDFTVEIIDLYETNGIEYAEIKTVGLDGLTWSAPVSALKEVQYE